MRVRPPVCESAWDPRYDDCVANNGAAPASSSSSPSKDQSSSTTACRGYWRLDARRVDRRRHAPGRGWPKTWNTKAAPDAAPASRSSPSSSTTWASDRPHADRARRRAGVLRRTRASTPALSPVNGAWGPTASPTPTTPPPTPWGGAGQQLGLLSRWGSGCSVHRGLGLSVRGNTTVQIGRLWGKAGAEGCSRFTLIQCPL